MSTVKLIKPKKAWKITQEQPQSVFIDVRSSMEYLFVGHPKGAISIPLIDEPDWIIDPLFTSQIRKLILGGAGCDKNSCVPILLICRSGKRSMEAGRLLVEEGFTEVFNIEGGFEGALNKEHHRSTINGWRFDNLPWDQC